MTYTDERQSIRPHAEKIVQGIRDLDEAISHRITSDDWPDDEKESLGTIRVKLTEIRHLLEILSHKTW